MLIQVMQYFIGYINKNYGNQGMPSRLLFVFITAEARNKMLDLMLF